MSSYGSALKSLASHSVGSIVYRTAGLALISIYALQLGPDALGRLERLLALSLLLAPVLSLQIQDAFLPAYKHLPRAAFYAAISIVIAFSALLLLLGLGLSSTQVVSSDVLAVMAVHASSTVMWQLLRNLVRAEGAYSVMVLAELLQAGIMLAAGVALLWAGVGILGAILAIALSNIAGCVLCWTRAPSMGARRISKSELVNTLREIFSVARRLLPNLVLWWGIELSDRLLLARYAGENEAGVYAAGARIAGIGMAVCLLIYQSWQVPAINRLSRTEPQDSFFTTTLSWYVAAVSLSLSLLACIIAPLSSFLFGPDFLYAKIYAASLMPSVFLASLCYFFGITLYAPGNESSWIASAAGFVVSLGINISLIPAFGAPAAVVASFLAYAVILSLRIRAARKVIDVSLPGKIFFPPLVVLTLQGICIYQEAQPTFTAIGLATLLILNRPHIMPIFTLIISKNSKN